MKTVYFASIEELSCIIGEGPIWSEDSMHSTMQGAIIYICRKAANFYYSLRTKPFYCDSDPTKLPTFEKLMENMSTLADGRVVLNFTGDARIRVLIREMQVIE